MKIHEIILEAEVKPYDTNVIRDIDQLDSFQIAQTEKMLRQFCSEYDKLLLNPIWRGTKNHNEAILKIDPGTGIRQSQNTTNYYTELMDHSPYFNGWPKRSRSLICTTDYHCTVSYTGTGVAGATYALFPARGSRVAICPDDDIWETFIHVPFFGGNISIVDLNFYLQKIGLSPFFKSMVNEVKSEQFARELKAECTEIGVAAPKPEDFLPLLFEAMSPVNAGFELMDLSDFAGSGIRGRELWIGDPMILVKDSVLTILANRRADDNLR